MVMHFEILAHEKEQSAAIISSSMKKKQLTPDGNF
jgi:hypothetical protein